MSAAGPADREDSRSHAGPVSLELRVANLDCDHDAAKIRDALGGLRGVVEFDVLVRSAKLRLRIDEAFLSRQRLEHVLREFGFPVVRDERPGPPPPWKNPKVLTSVGSGVLASIGWVIECLGAPAVAVQGTYVAALIAGGVYFGREALEGLVRERRVGIELLMSVAAVVALALGHAGEAAMLAFLYSISEAAEGYTEERTRASIRALMKLAPKTATVRRSGREIEVPVVELTPGDAFLVRPGAAVPTDGVVVSGRSTLNQAPITGESTPVEKQPSDAVFAGSINGAGALEVRATTSFSENTINRIVRLVEEAQEQRGRSQRFIERFGAVYSPIVLVAGLLVALVGPAISGGEWKSWVLRATVVVVAAAPCALAISVPITFVAALGRAASEGILIKGGVHLEELAKVRVIALDKTGTLTVGEPAVTDVLPLEAGEDSERVLALAAAVEANSEHPLARAIVRAARARNLSIPTGSDFESTTGLGATSMVEGRRTIVGAARGLESFARIAEARQLAAPIRASGKSVVFVAVESAVTGLIGLRDNLRANAREALEALRASGVERLIMLSGDNAETAQAIGREATFDEVFAELKPEDKVAAVRSLMNTYGHVAMVGDGVNDAPALATATVGIAMGAAGTDVALETADVALMADDLGKLAPAILLARRTRALVRQNLVLSALVIGALVLGAIGGVFTLPIAVLAHEVSEFVVIANGLRILRRSA